MCACVRGRTKWRREVFVRERKRYRMRERGKINKEYRDRKGKGDN